MLDQALERDSLDDRPKAQGPLVGLRVLELGHFVAAPFCTRLLADLGADIIKIEHPDGDPVRQWGQQIDGKSLWWSVHGRNKRSVTLDLKHRKSREIVLGLLASCDAVVENFRPGQLDRYGLDAATMRSARPDLVIARISGYGQDGPFRDRPAFGVIGEAMGGLRYLTNHPAEISGLPPVRVGVSIGDSLAGLYAAFGLLANLWARDRSSGHKRGGTVDVALTEAVLSLMEGVLPEYGALGMIRQPVGGAIPTASPSNAYPTRDGVWLLIAGNSDPLFRRLADLMGQPALADDPRFSGNPERVANRDALDALITAWAVQQNSVDLLAALVEAGIPATKVYDAADCAADPQYRYRGMVQAVEDPLLGSVLHTGIVPHLPDDPGRIRWPGPAIGAHTDEVLREIIGYSATEIAALRREGVIR